MMKYLLCKESVDRIFNDIGIKYESDRGFRCPCPIHGGHGNNFSYFPNSQRWKCWSHNCHEINGSDITGLLASYYNKDRESASKLIDNTKPLVKTYSPPPNIVNSLYDENILNNIKFESSYFEKRGFRKETIKHFQGFECHNSQNRFYKRAIIPIRNLDNKLVAFTGRTLIDSRVKWLHSKYFHKDMILYNLNNITHAKSLVIVEGPLDVWRLWECGVRNMVCTLGTSISWKHVRQIKDKNIKNIILLLDPDYAGSRATMSEGGFLRNLTDFNVISLRHLLKDDVGDTKVSTILEKIRPEIGKYE